MVPPKELPAEELKRHTPTAGYSVTLRLRLENKPGTFLKVVNKLAEEGGSLAKVDLIYSDFNFYIRDITINCRSEEHATDIVNSTRELPGVELLNWYDDTIELHKGGKLSINSRVSLNTTDELSRAYTPGVARVCKMIHDDQELAREYTLKGNTVAVVTDGSAVLGLGNIGPKAALPVMEGKSALFKRFANIDSFPICLDTQNTEEIIRAVEMIAPSFGGINLEDIAAPRCFEIEEELRKRLDIPVFHDDQHGTAVVVLAGVLNALKIVGKKLGEIRIVVNGFGAGGVACTRMLLSAGAKNIIACDSTGAVYRGRGENMNPVKDEMAEVTNPEGLKGSLAQVLRGADVFIGVSVPGVVSRAEIEQMAKDPIVFALANPVPEIMPNEIEDVARVIATGRSDYANQVNNVLCFPGIFRGALDVKARDITDKMKLSAARAIAESVEEEQLHERYIIPSIFRSDVTQRVAEYVREAATE